MNMAENSFGDVLQDPGLQTLDSSSHVASITPALIRINYRTRLKGGKTVLDERRKNASSLKNNPRIDRIGAFRNITGDPVHNINTIMANPR